MGISRRFSRLVLACLTALCTLAAGTPRVDCLCPNGNRKTFCLGFSLGASGCCCNGNCCLTASDDGSSRPAIASCSKPHRPCCSQPQQQATDESSALPTGMAAVGKGCQKTLVAGELAAVTSSHKAASAAVDVDAAIDLPAELFTTTSATGLPFLLRSRHQHPPPTDLVVVLQHFTI